jgi:hypothetical protein
MEKAVLDVRNWLEMHGFSGCDLEGFAVSSEKTILTLTFSKNFWAEFSDGDGWRFENGRPRTAQRLIDLVLTSDCSFTRANHPERKLGFVFRVY